jgi:hypothetical protein
MPRNLNVSVRSWIPSQGGGGLRSLPLDTQLLPFHPSPPLRALPITKRLHPSATLSSYPVDQVIGGKYRGGFHRSFYSDQFFTATFFTIVLVVKKQKCCGCGTAISVKIMPMKCASVTSYGETAVIVIKILKAEPGEIFVSHCNNLKYLYLFLELSEIGMFSWTLFQFFEREPNTFSYSLLPSW